jgi:hypothetical protein
MDVMITFNADSLDDRREAFTFAQALVDRVRTEQPGMQASFVTADDHYHVVIEDFGSEELKMAHGLYDSFVKRGLFSGRRAGRPGSTFTHERHSVSGHLVRRR